MKSLFFILLILPFSVFAKLRVIHADKNIRIYYKEETKEFTVKTSNKTKTYKRHLRRSMLRDFPFDISNKILVKVNRVQALLKEIDPTDEELIKHTLDINRSLNNFVNVDYGPCSKRKLPIKKFFTAEVSKEDVKKHVSLSSLGGEFKIDNDKVTIQINGKYYEVEINELESKSRERVGKVEIEGAKYEVVIPSSNVSKMYVRFTEKEHKDKEDIIGNSPTMKKYIEAQRSWRKKNMAAEINIGNKLELVENNGFKLSSEVSYQKQVEVLGQSESYEGVNGDLRASWTTRGSGPYEENELSAKVFIKRDFDESREDITNPFGVEVSNSYSVGQKTYIKAGVTIQNESGSALVNRDKEKFFLIIERRF